MPDPADYEEKKGKRIAGYIAGVVVNGILIFIAGNLYIWGVPVLTADYSKCIWALTMALGSMSVADLIFIFYDPEWFKRLLSIFTSIASLIALYVLNSIFPFKFINPTWINLTRIILLVLMVLSGISIVFNIIRTALPNRFKKY